MVVETPLVDQASRLGVAVDRRYRWFQAAWTLTALILFGLTWRLWGGHSLFPRVPVFPLVSLWCLQFDPALAWLIVFALVLLIGIATTELAGERPRSRPSVIRMERIITGLFATALLLAIVNDQLRMQAWSYHLALTGIAFLISDRIHTIAWLRRLTISIYIFSAISKFDRSFVETVGRQFLDTFLGWSGMTTDAWSPTWLTAIVLLLPVCELLIGVALGFARTRKMAVFAGVGLHMLLIAILGPWGLSHQPSVLVWNAFFALQLLLLFGGDNELGVDDRQNSSRKMSRRVWIRYWPQSVLAVAILIPLLEPIGGCDHWMSWGLYAPRNSRVVMWIDKDAAANLPQAYRLFLTPPVAADPGWAAGLLRLRLDQATLGLLGVPIYPSSSYQRSAAQGIVDQYGLEEKAWLQVEGKSERWSGQRHVELERVVDI